MPLVRLHPAVDDVIPVAARRWRKLSLLLPSTWSEIRCVPAQAARATIRGSDRHAGTVFQVGDDRAAGAGAQPRLRRAKHQGAAGGRSSMTCAIMSRRNQHAIARNRELTGLALGYAPQGAPDYGLDAARIVGGEAGGALRGAAALHGRAGQGMAGGKLAQPCRRAWRGFRSVAAMGHAGRADQGAAHRARASRGRACRIGGRSMRWRG